MNKAFTKEDEDVGVGETVAPSFIAPPGAFRISTRGAAALAASADVRQRDALARAEVMPAVPAGPIHAALGVTVHARASNGDARTYRLVTSEEQGLLGEGCSVHSPLGRALLGAEVGDTCEVVTPRKKEKLKILSLEGE